MKPLEEAQAAIKREDYDTAIQLLRPLAESGLAGAQYLLGSLYFTSADVDPRESHDWLQRAADQSHPTALYDLARWQDGTAGPPPSEDYYRSLLLRAAELGSADAQRALGCFYATGDDGFPKDEVLGRLWYGRAAAQGHADAQYNYGTMLLYGEGGPADREAAKDFIRRAAAQGDPCAIHFIENCSDEIA
jgi:hypothetical protein